MKFWTVLLLGLLVACMILNVYAKDDKNDSDASNDGNNSGAAEGDTSDSGEPGEDSGANALHLATMPVILASTWFTHRVLA